MDEVAKLLERGRRAARRGAGRTALRAFDRALAREPGCAFALFYRAQLRLLGGERRAAAADFRALESVPVDALVARRELDNLPAERYPRLLALAERVPGSPPWARVLRSFLLRGLQRDAEAVAQMRAAAAARPRDPGLRAFAGRVRVVAREADAGAAELARAAGLAPRCGWILAWLGEARRRQGRGREALRLLDRALRLSPAYALAFVWRGAVQARLGKPRAALADLDHALAELGDYFRVEEDRAAFVNYSLGWALNERFGVRRALGDLAGALDDLERAHAINTRYRWVPAFSPRPEDFARGLGELERLVASRPRDARARAWRGLTRLEAGDAAGALDDLERAARRDPRRPRTQVWLGRARARLGDARSAREDFDRALRLDPQCAEAHAWRGAMLRAEGRYESAIACFDRALRFDPICAWAYAWRGEARLARVRPAQALADLDRALAIHPGYADARAWRAQALRRLGRLDRALSDFDEALRLNPGHRDAYIGRGVVRRELGDAAGALADFRVAGIGEPEPARV